MKILVRIKPGSKKGPLVERVSDDELLVYVKERAVEGQANDALIKILSDFFDTPKTRISIEKGHKSRQKIVKIE